ncbi:metal ABC transporter solute-binding protein, Zn/Mn family [Gryllotalpicola protaetiae]|uniref:ABC transporter substrate-binding protein n=1 Tax=Gryllotalpicola protaetiae TaxID=2419771 RepID=A0A387BRC7_9MICO|nr:zinc ABC transporter substrate-binding protein [Gryllotalpicola protaetiae]AYG03517.1 ABC transporter substrate-binding protein [Gryllotalpicola protaetiae]
MNRSRLLAPIALTAAVLALAGCSAEASGATDPAKTGSINVVASTDVWGSVASAIGGDHVKVTSIIDDPDKDPHEYQADARNQLAISKANVVVSNGAGYDDFVGKMVKASKQNPTTLVAADISGYDQHPSDGDFNEHLWYDFPTVQKVAGKLEAAFAKADAKDAADFAANAKSFDQQLASLEATEAQLKTAHAGTAVTITEPVPLYMLNAIGLTNVTPEKFSEAIENDTDVAPTVLKQTLDLYSSGQVKLLAYNEQTTGAQTQAVLDAAKQNHVAVVPVTETLPAGKNYIEWMTSNLQAIGSALGE